MWKRFCGWILYKQLGWDLNITESHPDKYIICLAPHTSNWDFIIGLLYSRAEGLKSNFLIKKEWFVWPLNIIFRNIGGIPVWRSKHSSTPDTLPKEAKSCTIFHLCITPEGTRALNPDWKKGFYYIAYNAKIPILLYGLDYKKRQVICTKSFIPTGDIEREMRDIKLYFKNFHGKNPESFTIGNI